VQATLLAICIAILLALIAALAGPYFIDWGQYRSAFEAEASRMTGMPVRITGTIDLRLLPSPSLRMRGIEAGPPAAARLKARELAVELRLAPLFRGELRAAELRLVGPEVSLGLDADGRIDWPALHGVDLDRLSIEGLAIEDGRALVSDAGSGTRLRLDKLWFNGEVRSLLGPIKGEGGFFIDNERFGYRLSMGRLAEDSTTRVRLSVDPADRPLVAEAEGVLRADRGSPRFEGAVTLARPAGTAAASARAGAVPWRLAGKVKASPASALIEQIELQYGPDERAIKLTGVADVKFGKRPRFEGVMSARQIDLDSVLDLPEPSRHLPLAAIRALATDLLGALELRMPARLGIGIDTITLAGGQLQGVRGDLRRDTGGWDLEAFEFRAPGFAQARLSGRLTAGPHGPSFRGPVTVDASDPKTLVAWLEGRPDPARRQVGAWRMSGDVSIEPGRFAVERLKSEIDRQGLEGRFAYSFAGDRPTRLEAELKAAELDVDQAIGLVQAAAAGTTISWPSELSLALEVREATIAGVGAKNAVVKLASDGNALVLDKLSIADLGGATVDLNGRIEQLATAPQGRLTLNLDARGFDGVAALLGRVFPDSVDMVRPVLARLLPMKGRATLTVAPGGAGKLAVEATAGTVRLAVTGDASGALTSPAALGFGLSGEASAEDGSVLVALLGLDRAVSVDKGRATLNASARGSLGSEIRGEVRLAASGLTASAGGTFRLAGDDSPRAAVDLTVTAADASPLRRDPGVTVPRLPVTVKTRLTMAGDTLAFDDLAATIAGTSVRGRLQVALAAVPRFDGKLDVDVLDTASVMAVLVGMPAQKQDAGTWPAEPFGPGRLGTSSGRIAFNVARAGLTGTLVGQSVRGTLRFADGEVSLDDVDGQLGGGRLQGQFSANRVPDGLATHLRISLIDADATSILRWGTRPAVAARLSLQADVDGAGLSPAALVGSLRGSGVVTLDRAQLAGLDPKVFEAVTRAVDQGMAIDAGKIRDMVTTQLDGGELRVARAEGALAIASGQVRLANVIAHGEGADLMASGSLDLAESALDARLILSGPADRETAAGRPDIFISLKGPMAAPRRTVDVAALASWLMLRAVERETKRIEKLEAERHESALSPALQPPPPAAAPSESQAPPTPAIAAPAPPAGAPPAPAPPRSRSHIKPERPEASLAPREPAPALPPPIEIRPLPGSGKPARGSRTGSVNAGQPPSPPMPIPEQPPNRGILDQLFGPQR
jgi:large subunit ribosomal protein L24